MTPAGVVLRKKRQMPPPDPHEHACPKCGTKWEHDGADLLAGKPDYYANPRAWGDWLRARSKMHACPKCGELQFQRLDGTWEA